MISRLNSLGYAAGAVAEPLSAPARQALMEFQQAEALEVTGEIDAATIDAMRARFGR
jgi:peptidoglycan hydrolase-like protein with peptidoglycan-binding domain